MNTPRPTLVQEIAEAVVAFQERATGHAPKAVTVVLSQDTLVVVLYAALSPVEMDLARNPRGATQVQEFHRQLFSTTSRELREDMKRITGVEWTEAVAEVDPTTGGMVQAFARGATIQILHRATDRIANEPRGESR